MGIFVAKKTNGFRGYALAINPRYNGIAKVVNRNISDMFRKNKNSPDEYSPLSSGTAFQIVGGKTLRYASLFGLSYGLLSISGVSPATSATLSMASFVGAGIGLNYFGDMSADHIDGALKNTNITSHQVGVLTSASTSFPELISSFIASIKGGLTAYMSTSNFIGSNTINSLILIPLVFTKGTSKLIKHRLGDIITMSLTSGMATYFLSDGKLSQVESGILTGSALGYLAYQFAFGKSMDEGKEGKEREKKIKEGSTYKHLAGMGIGVIGLLTAGALAVNGLSSFALATGVSTSVVGLVMLAGATSLPEFFVSYGTRKRMKRTKNKIEKTKLGLVALDTIIKSNIINMGFMGMVGLINGHLKYDIHHLSDLNLMIAVEATMLSAMTVKNKYLKILLVGGAGALYIKNLM